MLAGIALVAVLACTALPACADTDAPRPKVFGIGLAQTGSSSLNAALQLLGYTTLMHDSSLVPFLFEDPSEYQFSGRYDHVDAVLDVPTAAYYRQMLKEYPDAKFILTTREQHSWYRSFRLHMSSIYALFRGYLPYRLKAMFEHVYGSATERKDTWMTHYNDHNKHVVEDIPSSQLLVMELSSGDGWNKLCAFLSRSDGPCSADSDVPFPHESAEQSNMAWTVKQQAIALQSARDVTTLEVNTSTTEITTMPWTPSKHAYIGLLYNPSSPSKRSYLIDALVAIESIRMTGSKQDVVMMVLGDIAVRDVQLLRDENVRVVVVHEVGSSLPVNYEPYGEEIASIYRTKARILQFVEYDAVIYFDSDTMFVKDCDKFFETDVQFIARGGTLAPLNTGFMVAKPSLQALVDINDVALSHSFLPSKGWMEYGPITDWRDIKKLTDWTFYCASTDQGLFYFYYFCYQPRGTAYLASRKDWDDKIVHFTGDNKPDQASDLRALPPKFREPAAMWVKILSNIHDKYGFQLQSAAHTLQKLTGAQSETDRLRLFVDTYFSFIKY